MGIRLVPYALTLVVIVLLGSGLYSCGVKSGKEDVQEKWDKEKKQYDSAIEKLRTEYADLELNHRIETQRISDELAKEKHRFEMELAMSGAEYDHRLRLSQARADTYQRQAQDGAAECRNLADHASRLDSSLEEGRSLVRELRSTLGLREFQIRALSQQIHNDRLLFTMNEYPEGSPDG